MRQLFSVEISQKIRQHEYFYFITDFCLILVQVKALSIAEVAKYLYKINLLVLKPVFLIIKTNDVIPAIERQVGLPQSSNLMLLFKCVVKWIKQNEFVQIFQC